MIVEIIAVGAGGFVGATMRHLLVKFIALITPWNFPFPILIVNLVACLLIGAASAIAAQSALFARSHFNLFFTVGGLGALSTLSSFMLDNFNMISSGNPIKAVINLVLTNTLCLLAVAAAYFCVQHKLAG